MLLLFFSLFLSHSFLQDCNIMFKTHNDSSLIHKLFNFKGSKKYKHNTFSYYKVSEMESNLPEGCTVKFEDPNALHTFRLIVAPPEGYWAGGVFVFSINVPEDYNIAVSMQLLMQVLVKYLKIII